MSSRSRAVGTRPSVILVREWEQQMSSSGCCGRLEGDFLQRDDEPVFAERRATIEAMGPLYRALRERFGDEVDVAVVDPRSFLSLFGLLLRDFRNHRVPPREAVRTLFGLPVQGVIVNGRLIARGAWPPVGKVVQELEDDMAVPASRAG